MGYNILGSQSLSSQPGVGTILFHQICSKAMMQHLSASGFADMPWKREEKTEALLLSSS